MKKLILSAILFSLFLFVSCQDKYIMPHTPGVTVDTEAFELYKNLWNSCGIKNYSYTYTLNRYPPLNFVAGPFVAPKNKQQGVEKQQNNSTRRK